MRAVGPGPGDDETSSIDLAPATPAGQGSAALAAAYERDFRRLVALASMVLGGSEAAEDIVQDSYVLCLAKADHIIAPGAYLTRTVVNQCRNQLRSAGARQRAYASVSSDEVATASHLVEFQDALSRLSDDQRIAIVLRYYLDMPIEAIAEHMGCPPPTVRSRLSRGLRHLRTLVG